MKKKLLVCIGAVLLLSACNTIHGIGEDLSAAGEGVANTAQKTKDKINQQ